MIKRSKIGIILILTLIALIFWGCSILSQSYKLGTEAALNKNWDEAVKYYERAMQENPNSSVCRLALFRAEISASYAHLFEARKLASLGKKEEALVEYEKALSYDPLNCIIAEEGRRLTEEEAEEEKQKIAIEPRVKLKVSEEKIQLKFVDAGLRSEEWASLLGLDIRYAGYIASEEKIVALIIFGENALVVEKGEMISDGVKVVEITPEGIEIIGPDSQERKYSLKGKKKEKEFD